MDNNIYAEVFERIKESISSEKPPLVQLYENLGIAVYEFLDAFIQFYDALCDVIVYSIEYLADCISEALNEYISLADNVPPRVKHFAIHSKKSKVRKKNYKRIWKRQKIP